ncbi:hypothetical protein F6Y05_37700 [Bacillus megaterium]|nr:hypothetical protein [Priestia megaterium]
MRNLENTTIEQLIETTPTIDEALFYFKNWYKNRNSKYRDIIKNATFLYDLSSDCLEEFAKIKLATERDPDFVATVVEATSELRITLPAFNAFRNSSYIYTLAQKKVRKQNILVQYSKIS